MKLASELVENTGADWRETLYAAFDLCLSSPCNFEWLINKAERGEGGGLWW